MDEEQVRDDRGGKLGAQVYWNAINHLREAWREVAGEELPHHGSSPKQRYQNAVKHIMSRVLEVRESKPDIEDRLRANLGIDAKEAIDDVLTGTILRATDLDDIPPNRIRWVFHEQAKEMSGDKQVIVPLREFLRGALNRLGGDMPGRRPNVGANRHWKRLLDYLRELEERTDWGEQGKGFRLRNAAGKGRVAKNPLSPDNLKVKIDPEFL